MDVIDQGVSCPDALIDVVVRRVFTIRARPDGLMVYGFDAIFLTNYRQRSVRV
jgi:hypothetical protein